MSYITVYIFLLLIDFLYAGHFLGNHTVIDILRKAGLEVESIPTETQLGRYINYQHVIYTLQEK